MFGMVLHCTHLAPDLLVEDEGVNIPCGSERELGRRPTLRQRIGSRSRQQLFALGGKENEVDLSVTKLRDMAVLEPGLTP